MSLVLVTSDRFEDHVTPPGHPERIERAETMQVVAARWADSGGTVMTPRAATDEDLARVHEAAYIESIAAARGRTAMLDPDTFTSPDSDEVARLAAGAVLAAVDGVLDARGRARAFALVRPPGHHAEAGRAMGFCIYNNVAIGAAWALRRGLGRIAVVDYDVHHGNGTQATFYDAASVLFISSHQYPFYPGTGAAEEAGDGEGRGFTVNLPMDAGAGDADFDLVYREVVVPVLHDYRPELVLVSAGFDAHERDPLAGMRMSTSGYGRLTARLLASADALCEGRVVFVTEGGYDMRALAECCQQVIDLSAARDVPELGAANGDARRGLDTIANARRIHRAFWPSLG
jgi:acetoin utilization deacetylase AcuC-like enzyme